MVDVANSILNYYTQVFDETEKEYSITSSVDDGYCMSTGLLMLDIVMNGGVRNGWITSLGYEGTGKSSIAIKMLGSLAKMNIPAYFIDAESALDTDYACKIAGINDISEYFGRRSANGKSWEVQPKIRYTSENSLEKVFLFMNKILEKMPDKLYREEKQKWYYVFSKTKEDMALMKTLNLKHDAALYTLTGKYWCEADNPNFQMVFIIDSLPALIAENAVKEDGDLNAQMGVQQKAYSKCVPLVRSLLRRKHAVLLAINQLRDSIGKMFGPTEFEPCGNTVKFASDVRNKLVESSVPDFFEKGKLPSGSPTSKYGEEKSVEAEGTDMYIYKTIKNIKNKKGTPFRQASIRLWISDKDGKVRGFDYVYDTLMYLVETNQVKLQKKGGRREIVGFDSFLPNQLNSKCNIIQYEDFKTLLVAQQTNNEELLNKFKSIYSITSETIIDNILEKCFNQIKSKEAFNLMISKKTTNVVTDESSENSEDFEDLSTDTNADTADFV